LHLPQLGPIHTPSFEEQAQGEEDQFHANNSEDDAEMQSKAMLQVGPISDDLEALQKIRISGLVATLEHVSHLDIVQEWGPPEEPVEYGL
jgi:hypothetical protein